MCTPAYFVINNSEKYWIGIVNPDLLKNAQDYIPNVYDRIGSKV